MVLKLLTLKIVQMKKLLLLLLIIPFALSAQKTTINLTYDGLARTYIQYVPSSYDGSSAVPVIFSLHGLGDVISNFSQVGFEQLADQHNFIVITPQAVSAPGFGTAWNSGAGLSPQLVLNGNVDDIGFITFIMDSLDNNFTIDTDRIYSTGFSMGSFMSHRLACELNDRIAAIASVAGAIGGGLDCQPANTIPVCHFHGTEDGAIGYTGNLYGSDAEETVGFWATNNGCDASPDSTDLPDSASDGITIKHYVYNNCDADVEFYRAEGAVHEWLFSGQNDISYSEKIWEFLSRYSLGGDQCSSVSVDLGDDIQSIIGQSEVLDATTTDATYSWSTDESSATITVTTSGTYWVEITVGECTARDTVIVDFVTSIWNNQNKFEFSLYPNPISNSGYLKINSVEDSNLDITVLDLIGKQIQAFDVQLSIGENLIPFELSNVAKGTYILNLEINGEKASRPFVVN